MDRLLRDKDLQQILAISRTALWRLRKAGKIRSVHHIGNRNYYRLSDVEAYLCSLKNEDF